MDAQTSIVGTGVMEEAANAPVNTEASPLLPRRQNATFGPKVSEEQDVPFKNIDKTRFRWLFSCILLAYILAFFDSTFMASSHPVITSYFDASNLAPWLSTVFYLSSTVTQPLFGRISDTIGRRPVLLFAMTIFGLTTAWCAAAQTIGGFVAARAVCGIGAGGVIALSNILMADVIKIEHRGLYQSYLNMAYGTGNGLGAALGSFLCDALGWRAAFAIQLPLILVFLVIAYFSVPSGLGPAHAAKGNGVLGAFKTFDVWGAVTLTITISALILGINLGGNVLSWTHPVVYVSLSAAIIGIVALVVVERRAAMPVLPLSYLSSRPFGNLMWSNFVGAIVTNTVLFNFPLLLQAVWQTSPTASGLWLLAPLIGISITSVFTGVFIKHTRKLKPMMSIGVLLYLVGSVAVSLLTLPGMPTWSIVLLNPYTSMAQGFHFPSTTVSVLALSPSVDQAVATTTLGLLRNLGAIMGVSMSSWVFQSVLLIALDHKVTGAPTTRQRVISAARKSVHSIRDLDVVHKTEVIAAYSEALRATFLLGAGFATIVICLILPVHLPVLCEREQDADEDQTDSDTATPRRAAR